MSGVFLPLTHTISRFFAPAKGDFYKVGFYLNGFGRLSGFRAFLSDGRSRREEKKNGTEEESDFQSCAFFLLYAFGFAGFWVTGLMDQVSRRLEFIALCFFLESFS